MSRKKLFIFLFITKFRNFFSRFTGLTLNEIAALLAEDGIAPNAVKDTVLFPPKDKNETDEDSAEEEDAEQDMNPDHFGPGLLNARAEVVVNDTRDCLPDCQKVNLLFFCTYYYHFKIIGHLPIIVTCSAVNKCMNE